MSALGFTQADVADGLSLVRATARIKTIGAGSAVNTPIYTKAQVTKSVAAALLGISDASVLYEKWIEACSGAAAGCINFHVAYQHWDMVPPERRYLFKSTDESIYYAIQSAGLAAVSSAYYDLEFVIGS
jgi:hypothetical protein